MIVDHHDSLKSLDSNTFYMSLFSKIKSKFVSDRTAHIGKEFMPFQMSSFSQSGEDLIIEFLFYQLGIKNPHYLDIGAFHPYHYNNTFKFYQKGAKGINVEADSVLFQELKRCRPNDLNLNYCVGDKSGRSQFYIFETKTLNTFSAEDANAIIASGKYPLEKIVEMPIIGINELLQTHCANASLDLLSVDVEGLDEQIINHIDFRQQSPKIICVETISFSDERKGVKNLRLIKYLEEQDYFMYADTYINSIFVSKACWD